MAVGLAGTVLPVLPGVPLMFAGMLLAAWIDDFTRVGTFTLGLLGVLTLLSVVVDIAASALGARRVGASSRAVWGAAAGAILGIFFGLVGLLLGPFVGAVVGELSIHGRVADAGRVGVATWVGIAFGAAAKIAIAFSMVGIFAFAWLVE
jgi:uncharacterized protein YqgC (DUF456 family)